MTDRDKPFVPNPLLGGLMGLAPLAAAARSLQEGVILGAGIALCSLGLGLLLPPLRRELPDRFRAPASLSLSALLALAYGLAIEAYLPVAAAALWVYLPLVSVNGLCLHAIRSGAGAVGERGISALLRSAGGFFLAACALGGVREAVGLGTLTLPGPGVDGLRLVIASAPPLRLLAAPAGGFMLLGLAAALYRVALRALGRRIP